MARGTNTFSLGAGFNITGQEPIDSRIVVSALSDLTTEETWNGVGLYNGLVVAVTESSTLYVLKNRDDVTNPESWVAVGGDVSADLGELKSDVEGLKTSKQDKVVAGNGIDISDGKTIAIKIDPAGSGLEVGPDGLKAVIPEAAEYTIAAADSPAEGYLKSYELRKNGEKVGVSIDIPKDLVVTKGEVKEVETPDDPYSGAQVGDLYLELTIANQPTPVYIPVKSLTDVYTGSTYISVDAGVISVKYDDLKNQINTDLVAPVSSKVTAVEGKVTALEATVGGEGSGLVKDVADLKTTVASDNVKEIDTTASHGVVLAAGTAEKSVKVVVTPATLATDISPNLSSTSIKVGKTISSGASIGEADSVATALEKLGSAIQTATSGGITSIESGDNTITVIEEGSTRDLKVNIAQLIAADSAIQTDESGKLDIFWTELV